MSSRNTLQRSSALRVSGGEESGECRGRGKGRRGWAAERGRGESEWRVCLTVRTRGLGQEEGRGEGREREERRGEMERGAVYACGERGGALTGMRQAVKNGAQVIHTVVL
eukprot:scaffold153175_cov33-Tisochrysis_lutea.AAC.2